MDKNFRFRINLSTRELEVEGSEDFVREYADKFEDVITSFSSLESLSPIVSTPPDTKNVESQSQVGKDSLPEVFGAYFQQFPKEISDIDKVLVAAYYTQMHDDDNAFSTAEANNQLKSMGIKVANASRAIKLQTDAKRVFPISRGKYRVSKGGVDYLTELLSK
jgi:hypothetical protein